MRVLNIGLDNTYASILLESLITALDELKNSKTSASGIAEQLRIINSVFVQLISTLNGVDFFSLLESLEQDVIASVKKIDPNQRLRWVGDEDQRILHECVDFLNKCSSAFKNLLEEASNIEVENGYAKLIGDDTEVEGGYEIPNKENEYEEIDQYPYDSDENYDDIISTPGERRMRAFSEPLTNCCGSHRKQFIPSAHKGFWNAVNIAHRLEKNNLLKIDDFSEKTITGFLFSVKRITKFFYDAFDLFKNIMEESKFHIPAWFMYNDEGKRCLEEAQKLSDILEKIVQQTIELRDAQFKMLECACQPRDVQTKKQELPQRQIPDAQVKKQEFACQLAQTLALASTQQTAVFASVTSPRSPRSPKPLPRPTIPPKPLEGPLSNSKKLESQKRWQKVQRFFLRGDKQSSPTAGARQIQDSTLPKPRGKTQ